MKACIYRFNLNTVSQSNYVAVGKTKTACGKRPTGPFKDAAWKGIPSAADIAPEMCSVVFMRDSDSRATQQLD
tara:strand:+ start:12395 stop:12613 length:219 start_codon:yes stop_codon:yes gene_type:complete